jgi:L-ascorbate metabolism protein UlaG (beta-lactamase superfamily)
MKFTYYGHSCFLVETDGNRLLFDPFITGNELAKHINISDIEADYILISHAHGDHTGDAVAIAQATDAQVVSSYEICNWLAGKGVKKYHPMNTGGVRQFEGFSVRCTVAQHSSSFNDGSYGGNPMGFIIRSKEGSFYYAGDTALTLDMQLIPQWAKLNFAVLPVGDNFTMGYEDAARAARMIGCNNIVGVHFDTFPYIRIDHEAAKNEFAKAGSVLHLPEIGKSFTI